MEQKNTCRPGPIVERIRMSLATSRSWLPNPVFGKVTESVGRLPLSCRVSAS